MRTTKILFIAALFSSIVAKSQSQDPILLKFSDDTVKLSEFKKVYEKNNSNNQIAKSSPEEYLDLYVKFRLKVKQAEDMQLDTLPTFIQELKGYRNQLAQPYLTDEKTKEKLKKETYERMKQEVKASHILIKVETNASAADTLAAYNKIKDIRAKALKGEDFSALAKQYSQDPSVRENGGDLGYFTAMFMVYPFETAAYNNKVGEISDIVRTAYGYHILKVTDKRPARGQIQVAHILIRHNKENADGKDMVVTDSKQKINEIYEKLKAGESFDKLAAEYSDDLKTAKSGGILPAFGTGKMIQPFEDISFSLKEDGDFSEPFKTQFGYHIVKRIKAFPLPPYEDVEGQIEKNMSRDAKKLYTTEAVVSRLKQEYNFKAEKNNLKDFYNIGDQFLEKNWNGEGLKNTNKVMFSYANQKATQKDFVDFLTKKYVDVRKMDRKILMDRAYNDFVNETILAYEDTQLERKYPEFATLIQEYHDGILLFELTERKVWNKAVKDSAGLAEFYKNNIDKYQYKERVDAIVYTAKDEKTAKAAMKLVKKRAKKNIAIDDIKKKLNESSAFNLEVVENKFSKGENAAVDKVEWKKGVNGPVQVGDKYVIVEIKEVLAPRARTIDEARGMITSDYQDYLEKEWIKSLEATYPVEINKEVLKKLEQ